MPRKPKPRNAPAVTLDLLVNIDVDDLARAERFYREAFSLRPGRRFGEGAVELLGAGAPIYLLVKPAGSVASPKTAQRRDYRRHWTPVHLDLVVPDLDSALERAVGAGAVLESEVRVHAWGRIAVLADPFGHGFCLLQFLGRGYDEIATPPSEVG
jgi:predicted enzyme related to lactoylglutathione lyase